MADNLQDRIRFALSHVRNPRLGVNVLDAEMIRDIAITPDGRVRLTLLLTPEDDATLVRDVFSAVAAVDGVADVRVDPKDASAPVQRKMLPVVDTAPKTPPRPPAPTPSAYPNLGRIIAVSSGKGGVGKSTVAVNLAVALGKAGAKVGLMDADIYGPNVPRMMGVSTPPPVVDQRMIPPVVHGIKVISLGLLIPRDQPAIWRGPIVMKLIGQFLKDVDWGQLDFLIVDMPPGTGDAQLSLVQSTHVHGAIIVTTPQVVATGDALRGVKMFERVNVPVLGIVENMSYFECPHCGKPSAIFGEGGGERLANEVGLPLLARIPLDPRVVAGGDTGAPIVVAAPESSAAVALTALATRVTDAVHATVSV
jgi:ATP-binding protein involved in chromosome partitioning